MADSSSERTEKPTARRIREARRKGQVPSSRDLTSAVTGLVLTVTLLFRTPEMLSVLGSCLERALSQFSAQQRFDERTAIEEMTIGLATCLEILIPLFVPGLVAGLVVAAIQTRGSASLDPILPKLERLDPVKGVKRILSRRSAAELGKLVAKLTIVGAAAVLSVVAYFVPISRLVTQSPHASLVVAGLALRDCALGAGAALVLLGAADWLLQNRLHLWDLRMTKTEVRRDHKAEEGDPLIRGWRRLVHREISFQKMLAATRQASVVVANPTHIAVAIRYSSQTDQAPRVVAKGVDAVARRIRDAATAAGVHVVHDRPLARALLRVELNAEIPESLFVATAEILAMISRIDAERSPDATALVDPTAHPGQ